jgi:soluble lytic murein transglycosylase-like protein
MGTEQLLLPAALAVFALSQARKAWDKIPASAAPFIDLFARAERAAGLPATLLARLAWQESRFDPSAKNPSGASGIMQLVPSAHPGVDPFAPEQAVPYAANYLKLLYKKFGSWEKALAAYNWGPGNVAKTIAALRDNWKSGLPIETRNYLAQIGADVGIT